MIKKKVLVNEPFKDVYNPKKIYKPGDTAEMTAERVAEIKAVNPNFVTVIGEVEVPEKEPKKEPEKEPEKEKGNKDK